MNRHYYSELLPRLAERGCESTLSLLPFNSRPLRHFLEERLLQPYGSEGSLLADPTFEPLFGWRTSDTTMSELAGNGVLSKSLVEAMDKPPTELREEYRFEKTRRPYTHQLEAWQLLSRPENRSLIIASGTGSGKTECFMVPILDRLARQREESPGQQVGVQALFLYPLNALINSQRDRLTAWSRSFKGDIRFCLYNGNTPNEVRSHNKQERPEEVIDRKELRQAPPSILVTNQTMLEYMLVRQEDEPILAQSQGKLRWIVLDEAHTYIGSQAAEVTLLLRRVMHAFGVSSSDVRFIATSATIGDPKGSAGQALRRFLSEMAGVETGQVELISGERLIPPLPPATQENQLSLEELQSAEEEQLSQLILNNRTARSLRNLFTENTTVKARRLSEVCRLLYGKAPGDIFTRQQQNQALAWLDLLSIDSQLLPLRGHLFHRTIPGLWACADRKCRYRGGTPLDAPDWRFGAVYLHERKQCHCGLPLFELVSCRDCSEPLLLAESEDGIQIKPHRSKSEREAFTLVEQDDSNDEEEEGDSSSEESEGKDHRNSRKLISNTIIISNLSDGNNRAVPITVDRHSLKINPENEESLSLVVYETANDKISCPICKARSNSGKHPYLHGRIGIIGVSDWSVPTLLEFAPDHDKPADLPYRGRRILSFNDSRQGTARLAASLQHASERSRIRATIYHILRRHILSGTSNADTTKLQQIRKQIATIQPLAIQNQALLSILEQFKQTEKELTTAKPLSFDNLARELSQQGGAFDKIYNHYRRQAGETFAANNGKLLLAEMLLIREFGRRPRRANSLETLGLVATCYPALEKIDTLPDVLKGVCELTTSDWQQFLKILLDHFVRGGSSLEIDSRWLSWIGNTFPHKFLIESSATERGYIQRYWPRANRSRTESMPVRLLSRTLDLDPDTPSGADTIDLILETAWESLKKQQLLKSSDKGWLLPRRELAFTTPEQLYLCPITLRLLDTTFRSTTPYLPRGGESKKVVCRKVELPLYNQPFGDTSDEMKRIKRARDWAAKEPLIAELRREGIWSDLHDRVIELAPYYRTAEHSAQQESQRLLDYESQFKKGKLNLLSCSTTMEMGIDIGGVSVVTMNNVPPHPANYLQRAGRAGRRGESRSLAFTICKPNPHDLNVFANSRWAFETAIAPPSLSLNSKTIVQRHLHSLLLATFLKSSQNDNIIKLKCGDFFLGDTPGCSSFGNWLATIAESPEPKLQEGVHQIVRHSLLEESSLRSIADGCKANIEKLAERWRSEYLHLDQEEQLMLATGAKESPALKAISLRKKRLADEYLLRTLCSEGFLPGYGFPTNLASFDNLTIDRFIASKRQKEESPSREENLYRRRELPSRELAIALREYAPGSPIVLDGLVYRSAGVTLNWKIPADVNAINEIQNLRFAWRCEHCGASGSDSSYSQASKCHNCDEPINIAAGHLFEYLTPAGFAVDFWKSPNNNLEAENYIAVEPTWINLSEKWRPLSHHLAGRFRLDPQAHIFNYSSGEARNGYAICLECGRTETMSRAENGVLKQPHQKLRRSKEEDATCPGSHENWKIKRNLILGYETRSDALELQLSGRNGRCLDDRKTAVTIAVALRYALSARLGVRAEEFGCEVKETRSEKKELAQSILLFDRHAAGYSTTFDQHIELIFPALRSRLDCPANCDSACPHCVLDFDKRFALDELDRRSAISWLDQHWL